MSNEPKAKSEQPKEQVIQLYQGAKRIHPKMAKGVLQICVCWRF